MQNHRSEIRKSDPVPNQPSSGETPNQVKHPRLNAETAQPWSGAGPSQVSIPGLAIPTSKGRTRFPPKLSIPRRVRFPTSHGRARLPNKLSTPSWVPRPTSHGRARLPTNPISSSITTNKRAFPKIDMLGYVRITGVQSRRPPKNGSRASARDTRTTHRCCCWWCRRC